MCRLVPQPRSPLALGIAVIAACTIAAAIPGASSWRNSPPPLAQGLRVTPTFSAPSGCFLRGWKDRLRIEGSRGSWSAS